MSNKAEAILDNMKLEDFEDGITQDEKFQLARDMTVLYHSLQSHDQTIFQLIAGFNALQKIIQEKLEVSDEQMQGVLTEELENVQKLFLNKVKQMETSEETEE